MDKDGKFAIIFYIIKKNNLYNLYIKPYILYYILYYIKKNNLYNLYIKPYYILYYILYY